LDFLRETFGEKKYLRKWNGKSFEARINRAVFDIMMYYFSDPIVREAAKGKQAELEAAFINLAANKAFLSALETTTKSLEANKARFSLWADALNNTLSLKLESPL
jgi:hypothetical protein